MTVDELFEMGVTAARGMPPVEEVAKMVDRMRIMDANAIVSAIMSAGGADYVELVRSVAGDVTVDDFVDVAAELLEHIYPGLYKDILKDIDDSKKLMDVLNLCATEVLDAST
jgi:3-keto-L-gulonate-6-phosphate decarboxylase